MKHLLLLYFSITLSFGYGQLWCSEEYKPEKIWGDNTKSKDYLRKYTFYFYY